MSLGRVDTKLARTERCEGHRAFGRRRVTRGLQWHEVKDWTLRIVNRSVGEDVGQSCGIRATLGAGVSRLFKPLNPGVCAKGLERNR